MKRKLGENLKRVRRRIADACAHAGREPKNVKLIAVTKHVPLDMVRTLVALGVTDLGESRPQAIIQRSAELTDSFHEGTEGLGASSPLCWHLVGHLQRNKVKGLLPHVGLIHSVDTLRLAEDIDAHSATLGRMTPILLEINAADEPQKHGCAVAAATHLVEQFATLKHIDICGLMAMAPLTDDVDTIRRAFGRTRELFDEILSLGAVGSSFKELSMGMSRDFELAIEFGATWLRIGSALFEGIALPMEAVPADEPNA
jgi:hypothetical protein